MLARQIIRKLEAKYTIDDIIARDPQMTNCLEKARQAAETPATILLRGESGTGKELFAHAIHNLSDRRYKQLFGLIVRQSANHFWKVNFSAMRKEHSPEREKAENQVFSRKRTTEPYFLMK